MTLKVRRYNIYCANQYYSQFFTLWFLKGYKIGTHIWYVQDYSCCEKQNPNDLQKTIVPDFTVCQKMHLHLFFQFNKN